MSHMMWFGNRGYERWVKAPAAGADFSFASRSEGVEFDGGGADVLGSAGSHARYEMEWNVLTRDQAQDIASAAFGIYSTALGETPLVYFIDPMQADRNIAPVSAGFPAAAARDAASLVKGIRPKAVATTSNALGYPALSAEYTLSAEGTPHSFYVPIPPGHKLWAGFHGSATGAGKVEVTPVGESGVTLTPLAVTSTTRVNTDFTGSGVDIAIAGNSGDKVTIAALILQILPADATPKTGGYLMPLGHSGCAFLGRPRTIAHSSRAENRRQVAMSATLVEVGLTR